MGIFSLFKNNKAKTTEVTIKKEDDDESTSVIGEATAINESVRSSTAQAHVKYSRPEYNPQTRKQYYDEGSAHKRAIDNAFAGVEKVKDPYSGSELVKKQRDAKIQFGENWQNHAAEADHIDPLSQIANRTQKNPFLTTDDVREIGNADDNFQVISRRLNQSSKEIGKGGSTQNEWADDSVRMNGLSGIIESDESINVVRKRIKDRGEVAKRRNDRRALIKSGKNAISTAHEAGKTGAMNTGLTVVTMSGIMNGVSVIKGEKSSKDAIADTIKDGGEAAVSGYVMCSGMTVLSQLLSYSSSEFIQALARNNVPGKIITAVMVTGDTLKKWGDGQITTEECLIQLGDKGLNMATMGCSMTVGQALIPIPIVGGAVGALIGSILTSSLYNEFINKLQTKKLEHEERQRIILECNMAAEQTRAFRTELEHYLDSYFQQYRSCFNAALSSMQQSFAMGDADGVIASANDITSRLGGKVRFENVNEFKAFLDSDEDDVL